MQRDAVDALTYAASYIQCSEQLEAVYRQGYKDGIRRQRERQAARQMRRKYLAIQKAMGIAMLAIAAVIPMINEGDATACLLIVPIGLELLLSKKVILKV